MSFTFFVVYGSLLPFEYTPLGIHEAIDRFCHVPLLELSAGQERADWLGTILFFVPVGFLWLAALAVDERGRAFSLLAASIVAAGAAILSVAIEFTQLWFPPRTVSQNDILGSTGGSLLGVLAWLAVGQQVTHWVRTYSWSLGSGKRLVWLLRAYCAVLLAYWLLPLDITFNRAELLRKLQERQIELVPFALALAGRASWYLVILHGLVWVPVGMLAGLSFKGGLRRRNLAIAAAIFAVPTIEVARLFVFTPYTSTTNILTGWCGVAVGVWLAGLWQAIATDAARPSLVRLFETRVWPRPALALVYAVLAVTVACTPWSLRPDPAWVGSRLIGFLDMPFASMYWEPKFHALTEVLTKTMFLAPLGFLLAWAVLPLPLSGPAKRVTLLLATAVAAVVAMAIEMILAFETIHRPDVTDFLLFTLGAQRRSTSRPAWTRDGRLSTRARQPWSWCQATAWWSWPARGCWPLCHSGVCRRTGRSRFGCPAPCEVDRR